MGLLQTCKGGRGRVKCVQLESGMVNWDKQQKPRLSKSKTRPWVCLESERGRRKWSDGRRPRVLHTLSVTVLPRTTALEKTKTGKEWANSVESDFKEAACVQVTRASEAQDSLKRLRREEP
uniref:Uncharacterized protein n=1 Tax=Steinernema glaseri TaxID=37863 RepID=A0A1I7ZM29_9BILA